jgi:membrane-bound metal-dependent hydrolase YbcI (DUF457 family)
MDSPALIDREGERMFIGHFAVGFAARRAAPRTSLATLLTAAAFLDLLWPLFLWLGLERVRIAPGDTAFTPLEFESYPFSHSLLTSLGWALLCAAAYRARTKYARGALWVGVAVFSHWVLDFVSHRADLPLVPWGGPRVGLGLWNSVAATAVTEIAMFLGGLALYLSVTRARRWQGHVSLWGLVGVLAFLYAGSVRGTPPPSVEALKIVSSVVPVFVLWFVWIDRTREPRLRA